MFCSRCAELLPDDSSFCSKCGHALTIGAFIPPAHVTKKSNRGVWILLALLALVAVFVLLLSNTNTPLERTPSGTVGNSPLVSNTIPVNRPSPTTAPPDNLKDTSFQKAEVYATAEQLMIDRQTGGVAAAEKYLGKVIEVQGVVDTASSTGNLPSVSFQATGLCAIPRGNSVNCFWMAERERRAVAKLQPGDSVTVLGRFDKSGRYAMPKEYDIPGCAYYINLQNCTVKEPTQTLSTPETAAPVEQSSLDNVAAIRKAAEQGNADAQSKLGTMYYDGQGLPQDYSQALYWSRKAADQGYATAQDNIGVSYFYGEGVSQDYVQAAYWYRKAAEQGYAKAEVHLGVLYYQGQGVPQDYGQTYFWIVLAASGTFEGIKPEDVAELRDAAASHLTTGEISQALERVRKWHEEHPQT
jgi:hypothetical protein